MSSIVSLRDIAKSHGARALFTGLSLTVSDGERVGLIGANGSGKSTLLSILAGLSTPDAGERTLRKNARLAYMAQVDAFPEGATAWEAVAEPLRPLVGHGLDEPQLYARVGEALSRTGFTDFTLPAAGLSGGWTKRLALARALVQDPDVLFLDEPTNHLDLESVLWLEKVLARAPFAFVMVSHDRVFLENVTTRTVELDASYPGGCLAADGPYSSFLEKREEHLVAQAGLEQALASKARREIAWLRRGAKARTTKAKARIDEAGRIMEELDATRQRNLKAAKAGIDFSGTGRQTKRLLVAEGLGRSIGDRTLFRDLDLVLSPGSRLGVVGANGSGKSTLLSLLAGETTPDAGEVRRAPGLELAYFDQAREHLDKSITLKAAFAPHGDAVVYRDRSIHVATWAKRFLFRPEQLDLPVGLLSGGEQARVLIARLMLRPADVLLLDEPTNDLDIPTLEVLEDSLADFPGAVVLITHDRYLLDSVSTLLLGLDGEGGTMFLADYAQWESAREEMDRAAATARDKPAKPVRAPKPSSKKLTYKEQREWDGMEEAILLAEEALAECKAALEDPAVASDHGELQARLHSMEAAQAEVDRLYARWAELEDKLA